jgi:ATP-dependent DNA ligase
MLGRETPASLVAWDLLAEGDDDLRAAPLTERRARLERALAGVAAPIHVSPSTVDRRWHRTGSAASRAAAAGGRGPDDPR